MGTSVVLAYVWAAVSLVFFFLLAVIIAGMIQYRPGGNDETMRKIWFWVMCVLASVVGFIVNVIVASGIEVASAKDSYLAQSGIAAAVAFMLFILIGLILSKSFSRSKISSWF